MTRRLGYHWHLRQVMAAHQMWKTTDLTPLLHERGVNLSAAQVYRLVTDKPERLSLVTLAALCDIFDCTPTDLVEPFVVAASRKRATNRGSDAPSSMRDVPSLRPVRARILDPGRD